MWHGFPHPGIHQPQPQQQQPQQQQSPKQKQKPAANEGALSGVMAQASLIPMLGLLVSGKAGIKEMLLAILVPPIMSIGQEVGSDLATDITRKAKYIVAEYIKAPLQALNILEKEAVRTVKKTTDDSQSEDCSYEAVLRYVLESAPSPTSVAMDRTRDGSGKRRLLPILVLFVLLPLRRKHSRATVPVFLAGAALCLQNLRELLARWRDNGRAAQAQPFHHLALATLSAQKEQNRKQLKPLEPQLQLLPEEGMWSEVRTQDRIWFRQTEEQLEVMATGSGAESKANAFIHDALTWFDQIRMKQMSQERWLFRQQGSQNVYKGYKLTDVKTFDMLFFDRKEEIIQLLRDFEEGAGLYSKQGFPRKMGLLLRGPPGTGKTSLVKALAVATGRHVVCVDLAKIVSSHRLWKTLIDLEINTEDKSGALLTHSNTVFLIEEVDATGKALQRRVKAPKTPLEAVESLDVSLEEGYESWDDEEKEVLCEDEDDGTQKPVQWKWEWLEGKAKDGTDMCGWNPMHHMHGQSDDQRNAAVQAMAQQMGARSVRINMDGHCTFQKYGSEDFAGSTRGTHGHERGTWVAMGSMHSKAGGNGDSVYDSDYLKTFLEILDGIIETPGRMVVMTTNHPEKLDPALLRPGRVNAGLYMGRMSPSAFKDMVEWYCSPPDVLGSGSRQRYHDEPPKLLPEEESKAWWLATCYYLQPSWVEQECALYYTRAEFFASIQNQMQRDDTKRRPINARLLGTIIFHFLGLDPANRKNRLGNEIVKGLSELAQHVRRLAPSACKSHSQNTHDLHRPRVHTKILQRVSEESKRARQSFQQAVADGGVDSTDFVEALFSSISAGLEDLEREGTFNHEERHTQAPESIVAAAVGLDPKVGANADENKTQEEAGQCIVSAGVGLSPECIQQHLEAGSAW